MASSLENSGDRGRLPALGWAVFVACSWTWCIGMYLPVLMVRDFGPAGWFVFMAPNVIGAASVGWVLQRQGAAASLARRHWHAAAAFSLVTVLFHAFFTGWVIYRLVGQFAEVIAAPLAIAFCYAGRRGRRDLVIAAILFVLSTVAFILAASRPDIAPHGPIGLRSAGLIYLTPVVIFGFLLCPYLDLTFLRAKASTDSQTGITAFTLGFGIFFIVMIIFTMWYSRLVQPAGLGNVPRVLAWLIAAHMMLQSAFTVALHTRALSEDRRARKYESVAAFLLAIVALFLLGMWSEQILPHRFSSGEFIYRIFMAFYGLVFPAYVWLFMVPRPGVRGSSTPFRYAVLAIAIVIAAPMFWLGFIDDRMIWLLPGLGVVLLAKAFA